MIMSAFFFLSKLRHQRFTPSNLFVSFASWNFQKEYNMKFLITLSVLATSTAFAQSNRVQIRCYEPAPQGGSGSLAYILEERGLGGQVLHLTYPFHQPLRYSTQSGCLQHPGNIESPGNQNRLVLCPAQGQSVRNLVPVDAYLGDEERTVYCERRLLNWFTN
jgi:hypothetical protein